ncbi:MAG: EF-hand domain-containing protein [Xanthomonadales bacterium]
MKNPDYTAVKASLMIAVVFALAALPLVTYADAHRPSPPTLEDFDSDGDGFVSEDEFVTLRAARMKAHAEAGHTMRGAANAPTFSALDGNGDGKLDRDELTAGQEAHRAMMHEGRGEGRGGRHGHARPMPSFADLDLDGNGCIDADEFAQHQAERHGRQSSSE